METKAQWPGRGDGSPRNTRASLSQAGRRLVKPKRTLSSGTRASRHGEARGAEAGQCARHIVHLATPSTTVATPATTTPATTTHIHAVHATTRHGVIFVPVPDCNGTPSMVHASAMLTHEDYIRSKEAATQNTTHEATAHQPSTNQPTNQPTNLCVLDVVEGECDVLAG